MTELIEERLRTANHLSGIRRSKRVTAMNGETRHRRSHNEGFPEFIKAEPSSQRADEGKRDAERLLLSWLKQSDPNILGLRKVDEDRNGRSLTVVHIAIPLDYSRTHLARALGISQLEDKKRVQRFNITVSMGRDKPLSYVRVPAAFLISRVLGAAKKQLMRLGRPGARMLQHARPNVRSDRPDSPDQVEENRRVRSAVKEGLAARGTDVEPHQIEILTHRDTGEKWVRIVKVDRGRRTALRLVLKRAGIHAVLALENADPRSDWSIRFLANEVTRLARQSYDSFDVHSDHTAASEPQPRGFDRFLETETRPIVRLSSIATSAASANSPSPRRLTATGLESARGHASARTRSVS
jgi:hypothetical protein